MAETVTLAEVLPLALKLSDIEKASLVAEHTTKRATSQQVILTPGEAAQILDRLRADIGPVGISVTELIEEGRYR